MSVRSHNPRPTRPVIAVCSLILVLGLPTLALADLLAEIQGRGSLRNCMAPYTPLNVKDPLSGAWSGINVELAEAFVAELGVEHEIVEVTFRTAIPALQAGRCDVALSGFYINEERRTVVDFSDPVGLETSLIVVHRDSPAQSFADIDQPEQVVGVAAGGGHARWVPTQLQQATVKEILYEGESAVAIAFEVANRRVDAGISGSLALGNFSVQNPAIPLRFLPEPLREVPYAFIVPKGEQALLERLNGWLEEAKATGLLAELERKYLGAAAFDVPTRSQP